MNDVYYRALMRETFPELVLSEGVVYKQVASKIDDVTFRCVYYSFNGKDLGTEKLCDVIASTPAELKSLLIGVLTAIEYSDVSIDYFSVNLFKDELEELLRKYKFLDTINPDRQVEFLNESLTLYKNMVTFDDFKNNLANLVLNKG